MSYEIIEKNLVLKTSNAKTIHLLGVKDERFMAGLYMTTKYISPLVLFFDQGHKVPNIDSKSFNKIRDFMENNLRRENKKIIRKNASKL